MTRSAGSKKVTPEVKAPQVPKAAPDQWQKILSSGQLILDRYGWDFVGVFLFALAFILLLGLVGWTRGSVVSPLTTLLGQGLGRGSFLLILLFILCGIYCFRRRIGKSILTFSQILSLEGWAFCCLALLALFNGRTLELAVSGMGGGVIGWGMIELIEKVLPFPGSAVILICLLLIFTVTGFGFVQPLLARIDAWLNENKEGQPVQRPNEKAQEAPVQPPAAAVTSRKVRARTSPAAAKPVETARPAPVPQRDERLPPLNLLMQEQTSHPDEAYIHDTAQLIERTLEEFGVPARVVGFRVGPTVTQYAVEPGFIEKAGPEGEAVKQKVRVAQISGLGKDLALALSAERLRIEAPVPGRSFVGIEVPNQHATMVRMRPILETEAFQKLHSPLALALGKDVSGLPVVGDLARMPHLLIAGTTGSGKSVCIAALTACLVLNNTPSELRLAMMDPKMVELVRFNGLPHLFGKVETEIDRMLGVLRWALMEMDARYRLLESIHARDLDSYNHKMERRKQPTLPRIVIIIDELADLMMSAPDQTEHSLVRLAQMARATGIHLVVATQRPSTDVVTGLIKANFPARISFTVASSVDSRVILDTNGAETLLGRGDMLFLNPEAGSPQRAQGVLISDQEVERLITFWQKMSPADPSLEAPWESLMINNNEDDGDKLVEQAIKVVRSTQHASASLLQRRLRIGYPRAARLIDELEELGVVGPAQGGGREREVLLSSEDDDDEGDDNSQEDTLEEN